MTVEPVQPAVPVVARSRTRSPWREIPSDRLTRITTLALIPPVTAAVMTGGIARIAPLAGAILIAVAWSYLFAHVRGRPMDWFCIPAAAVFALLVPAATPIWQALLAVSFGIVVGNEVFGGRGFSFVHPAVAGLAFLFFSFPLAPDFSTGSSIIAASVLPGALLLLASGLIAWRTVIGLALGLTMLAAILGTGFPLAVIGAPALAIGIIFLAFDPASGAATHAGRLFHGFLTGSLLAILGAAGQGIAAADTIVFATLLGSIFAPLIDRIVITWNMRRRRDRLDRA